MEGALRLTYFIPTENACGGVRGEDTGSAVIPDLIGNLVNLLKYLVVSVFFSPPTLSCKKQRTPVYRVSFNNFNFICRLRMEVAFPLDCILGIKETKTFIVCPKSEGFVQTLSCRWHSLYLTSGAFVSPSADRILR